MKRAACLLLAVLFLLLAGCKADLSASDGYDVTINALIWDSYDVILSISNGSEPLAERQRPLRVVIPGYDSGKWVRLVTEIRFYAAETEGEG